MRQRRWLKLVKDFDCTINYHPRKVNVVADTLSRKYIGFNGNLITTQPHILEDLRRMDIELVPNQYLYLLSTLKVQPSIRLKRSKTRMQA